MSEMGRTPRINANAGRDHWTHCYGMWFAGAGIRAARWSVNRTIKLLM